jgi:hypothetical protein
MLLGIFFGGGMGLSSAHADESCERFNQWQAASDRFLAATGDFDASREAEAIEWRVRTDTVQAIVARYFETGETVDAHACLAGRRDRANFLNSLQAGFFNESLARLRQAKTPGLRRLIAALDKDVGLQHAALFRMTGHGFGANAPTVEKAGFHRATKSIFMDISRIPANEWLFIFTHELLHSLDPLIYDASRVYEKTLGLYVKQPELVESFQSLDQLSPEASTELIEWVEAGLGRGLWAEHRAWVVSFALFEDGRREGLWGEIDWVQKILSERAPDESLESFVYRYLDQRSKDPEERLFQLPLVQSAIFFVRERTRQEARRASPPPLGRIGGLIQ